MKKNSFQKLVWYFFIYSFLGMLLENAFCLLTSLKIESRKGFIIGPFCPIYGLGAIILTILLSKYSSYSNKKEEKINKIKVFFLGIVYGSAFEYLSSYVMQATYGVEFWDYSNMKFNLNGRTSVFFALCWGVVSFFLIFYVNKVIDKFIKKFNSKSLAHIMAIYMLINASLTYLSINNYVNEAYLKINNTNTKAYVKKYSTINKQFYSLMSTEVMKKVYPNMILVVDDNNKIKMSDLF